MRYELLFSCAWHYAVLGHAVPVIRRHPFQWGNRPEEIVSDSGRLAHFSDATSSSANGTSGRLSSAPCVATHLDSCDASNDSQIAPMRVIEWHFLKVPITGEWEMSRPLGVTEYYDFSLCRYRQTYNDCHDLLVARRAGSNMSASESLIESWIVLLYHNHNHNIWNIR